MDHLVGVGSFTSYKGHGAMEKGARTTEEKPLLVMHPLPPKKRKGDKNPTSPFFQCKYVLVSEHTWERLTGKIVKFSLQGPVSPAIQNRGRNQETNRRKNGI